MRRVIFASLSLALVSSAVALLPVSNPPAAAAAGCVRFVASNFDAPGDDRLNLNAEWVRIKNTCASAKSLSGWVIHDYNRNFTYKFPSGVSIGAGKSITLHTGKGTATASHRYWNLGGAVWNNSAPEYAYLKNSAGTLMSKWTEY